MTGKSRLVFAVVLFAGILGSRSDAYTFAGDSWGSGANVSYSFNRRGGGGYTIDETATGWGVTTSVRLPSVFDNGWADEIRAAFDTWAAVADISFREVGDSHDDFDAAGAKGDVRIAAHLFDGPGGVYAHSYPPPTSPPYGESAAGDVHFDTEESWHVGAGTPGPGEYDLFSVALHEIGHAIGIGDNDDPTSVMYSSYWYNSSGSLGLDDVEAAQDIYGTPEPPAFVLILFSMGGLFLAKRTLFARTSSAKPSRERMAA